VELNNFWTDDDDIASGQYDEGYCEYTCIGILLLPRILKLKIPATLLYGSQRVSN